MVTVSLDSIVRNILLKRRYSLHWYLEFLLYAKECLREISMDDLQVVNFVMLPVDANGAANLPNDYLDEVSVNLPVGQKLKPLVKDSSITPLQAFDSDFALTTYQLGATQVASALIYNNVFLSGLWNTTTFNEYGEPTGRFFGIGAASPTDTYNIIKSRNQIQLNEALTTSSIILAYIGNGTSSDAATQIDPYAEKTIDTYCMYLFKENNRTYSPSEAKMAWDMHIQQRQILRARMSDLTVNKIRRIIQSNSTGSIHN